MFETIWRVTLTILAGVILVSVRGVANIQASAPGSVPVETFVTGLGWATAITFDRDQNLYLADNIFKRIRIFDQQGDAVDEISIPSPVANAIGQVLGLALDPDYPRTPVFYVHYLDKLRWSNVIVRFRYEAGVTSQERIILDIPLPPNPDDPENPCTDHNGGHIVFAPGGSLFIGMGDNCHGELVDDLSKPQGKILRIHRETGQGLPDNPYYDGDGPNDDRIWALGVRNPFGLAFDPVVGTLWAADNGPGCGDEVNRIAPKVHYGWPHSSPSYFECVDPGSQYIMPAWEWQHTIGPTGVAAYHGPGVNPWHDTLLVCDWNTGSLRRLQMNRERKEILSEEIIDIGPAKCRMDVDVDAHGNIYLVDMTTIYRIAQHTSWLPMLVLD